MLPGGGKGGIFNAAGPGQRVFNYCPHGTAASQDHNSIGQQQGFFDVVGDKDNGYASLVPDAELFFL